MGPYDTTAPRRDKYAREGHYCDYLIKSAKVLVQKIEIQIQNVCILERAIK